MLVEALPGFENLIIQKQPQEQPDSGGVRWPSSFLKGIELSRFNHDSTVSRTLAWSRGLKHEIRGVRRGRRLGCRCAVRGISHRCGDRTGTIINSPRPENQARDSGK